MEEENEGGSGGGEAEREKGDWEGGGREAHLASSTGMF